MKKPAIFLFAFMYCCCCRERTRQTTNKTERVQWNQDLGFGMFIHWNVAVVFSAVINHSLTGASDENVKRYFRELPFITECRTSTR